MFFIPQTNFVSAGTTPPPVSVATLTTGHAYKSGRDGWLYKSSGYDNNTDDYPLIIFMGGLGTVGTNINDYIKVNEGAIRFLYVGDRPSDVIIFAPQVPALDYTADDFDKIMTYLTSNYRINTNRVYLTGLSGGAFGCRIIQQARPTQVAAVLAFSGSYNGGWNFSDYTNIGNWWHHGTADGTVPNALETFMSNANDISIDMNISWLVSNYYNLGHSYRVWDDNGYNRRDRTDQVGKAKYDYVAWLKKFSIDANERASLHVDYAETENNLVDYRLALIQVNALSSGSLKTSLLNRLTTLKSNLDNGGKRYIIDHGITGQESTGNINNMTVHTNGANITNLIADDGTSSSIGFRVNSQCANSTREANLASNKLRGLYFGYPDRNTFRDGMTCSTAITTGQLEYFNLNNSKTYSIRIYPSHAGSSTVNPVINITINSVTKSLYCELNCTQFIEFLNISPISNNITIDIGNSGDTNTYICVMELLQNP